MFGYIAAKRRAQLFMTSYDLYYPLHAIAYALLSDAYISSEQIDKDLPQIVLRTLLP